MQRAMVLGAATIVALVACERAPANDAEQLSLSYDAAAAEFSVPRPLLASIGWVETRWHMRPGVPARDGCYGTMHLCDWGDDGPLMRASRLTGLSPEALRTDRDANIRGAAALLRADADRYFAETKHLSDRNMADWWQVVMRWSNATDPAVADDYATQVFQLVNRGARGLLDDGSVFEVSPQLVDVSREKLFGEMSSPLTPDYAQAKWIKALRSSAGRDGTPIDRVILHTAQGSYSGTISWFQDQRVQASAHYVVRSSDGDITQMVEHKDTAWHAGNWAYNLRSIGIEHEGYVDRPVYLTDAMYNASAALTRWICDTHQIPKDRQHVIGHNEVPDPDGSGWGGKGHHSDPCVTVDGSQCFWNWAHYMQLVGGTSGPTTGTIRGTVFSSEGGCVYDGGLQNCTVRVPGARVFFPETGDTQLADGSGNFRFELAPGRYSPSGSASGFHDSGPVLGEREVVAGGTTWSSFILQKIDNTATVTGFAYAIDRQNEADRSQRLDGVVVGSDASNVISTDTNGEFTLTVPAGEVTITARKGGWLSATETFTVAAGGTRTLELGLLSDGEDLVPPGVTFTRPTPNATLKRSPSRFEGSVSEPVVALTVGGQTVVPGADLKWSVDLELEPGVNEIVALATDAANNTGDATLTVTFEPPVEGIEGVVRDLATGRPVAGAVLTAGSAFATTDEEGWFSLGLAAGPRSVAVQANGYAARSFNTEVPAGERVPVDVLLTPTGAGPLVVITSPTDGSTVSTPQVEVRGTVALSPSPTVRIDAIAASVTGDSFSSVVNLAPGENVLTVFARTEDGRSASATVRVTYMPVVEEEGCGCAGAGPGAGVVGLLFALAMRRRR